MKSLISSLAAVSLLSVGLLMTSAANAEEGGRSEGTMPRSESSPVRLSPVIGTSSFTTANDIDSDEFGDTLSAGVFADFGSRMVTFETGILTLQTDTNTSSGGKASVDIDTWGIPLLARVNFSGKPQETVFLKAGAMPINTSGATNEFDVLGVAGIGGNIPLGHNSSILLDASYNRRIKDGGELGRYQGISLLAGLTFNL
jgi:hypothetical protein